jgi:hypothetical protein
MHRHSPINDHEPLIDKTHTLPLRSKRTERLRKKQERKKHKSLEPKHLLDLPYEVLLDIFSLLRPSDTFVLSRVSKSLHNFIHAFEPILSRRIIAFRYPILSQCFRLPIPLVDVPSSLHPALQSLERYAILAIHKNPYQHVKPPDPNHMCTCLTCLLRWNMHNLALDFAHWQPYLDAGEPLPTIARGRNPAWNTALVTRNAAIVDRALHSGLWYARILEAHLDSTVRAVRRHGANKGNRRRRFRMTEADAASGFDGFLGMSGPPSLEFPFNRDNYYMLEAYLPNRGWSGELQRWMYVPESQHDVDIGFVEMWAKRVLEKEERKKKNEVKEGFVGS